MAEPSRPLVTESTLRDLVTANLVTRVTATSTAAGFEVSVRFGDAERVLGNSRGEPKAFASLNTVAGQLKRLGIVEFSVNAAGPTPGRVRSARPDRAEAMRRTAKEPVSATPPGRRRTRR